MGRKPVAAAAIAQRKRDGLGLALAARRARTCWRAISLGDIGIDGREDDGAGVDGGAGSASRVRGEELRPV